MHQTTVLSPDLISTLCPLAAPVWQDLYNNLVTGNKTKLKLQFFHIFTFIFTTMQSHCCHVDGLDNLMSYTVQYVLITSSWVKWPHSLESWPFFRSVMKRVHQAALRLSGIRLIRELLAWASSVMDTLPLCLMNRATESSSSGVMEINFPLSSITPESNIQHILSYTI